MYLFNAVHFTPNILSGQIEIFIGSHREMEVVRVLLLVRNSLGRTVKQLELMMHWPHSGRNLYRKPNQR